jgi:ABC-type Zn uptake system ZnuABC Zn-binding protein ZnuA
MLTNVKKTLKDIKKKLIFIFPSDGGMSNATKMISTMSKKIKKKLRDIKKKSKKIPRGVN